MPPATKESMTPSKWETLRAQNWERNVRTFKRREARNRMLRAVVYMIVVVAVAWWAA